ncbi:hypothetical protein FRB99_002029 [Tulasnella sp. 403]|nr:hypothetical protein FRB99_002029 [Tulasnella sp. 403]
MSVQITTSGIVDSAYEDDDDHSHGSGQSEEDNKDLETWDDWIDDDADTRPCKSLFDEEVLDSVLACVRYDKEKYGVDVGEVASRLGLDFLHRAKLINWIRKEHASPDEVKAVTANSTFLSDDTYLKPTLEDDPLLLLDNGSWSDSDDNDDVPPQDSAARDKDLSKLDKARLVKKVRKLQAQLVGAREAIQEMREAIQSRFDLLEVAPAVGSTASAESSKAKGDDSSYFESYANNDIHAVMIQDTVRTSSYAKFILRNATIFKDAVVMDVGCGTGILSMFAAKAGAKRVIAIDASDIVVKARQIVADNGYENVITVIRSKVEDLDALPDGIPYVDVIVSEWMGYCCIYESMLDSVLVARDKFLRKGGTVVLADGDEEVKTQGLMAPSQCRMFLGFAEANDLIRERIKFWDDVHSFSMNAMQEEVYHEAVVDIIPEKCMLGSPVTVKDIPLQHITVRQLDFKSPFKLTTTRSGELNAFVVYFDTFFTTDGQDVPPDAKAEVHKGDFAPGDVIRIGERRSSESFGEKRAKSMEDLRLLSSSPSSMGRRKESVDFNLPKETLITSDVFTSPPSTIETATAGEGAATPPPPPPPPPPIPSSPVSILSSPAKRPSLRPRRPYSMPTHWKQTVFILRSPVRVRKGTVVTGMFHCRKSEGNARELDVEIHYVVEDAAMEVCGEEECVKETVVQMFKAPL